MKLLVPLLRGLIHVCVNADACMLHSCICMQTYSICANVRVCNMPTLCAHVCMCASVCACLLACLLAGWLACLLACVLACLHDCLLAGLGWAGLGWAGLGWAGLGWAGLLACLLVCFLACLFVCLSACLPVCLRLAACLAAWLPVCLPACLSVCLSVRLSVCVWAASRFVSVLCYMALYRGMLLGWIDRVGQHEAILSLQSSVARAEGRELPLALPHAVPVRLFPRCWGATRGPTSVVRHPAERLGKASDGKLRITGATRRRN